MRALVRTALALDGHEGELAEAALLAELRQRGYDVETVDCRDVDVVPCTGCGSCGLRTPGACSVKDDMQGIFRKIVASDVLVHATPVRFGSYCAELKKVVDRFQPLMVPIYVVRDGEMHFQGRYDLPALVGVGLVRDQAEADAFRFLLSRLAVNIETPHAAAVLAGGDEAAARSAIDAALTAVAREHEPAVAGRPA
jgi:NAD(P)H-dependent FMN reductase